jgi:hypothetical protein
MNRTDSIKDNSSSRIDQAERAVLSSVRRFEHAMENLAQRVEESSQRVQHTIDLANKSKDDLFRLKDNVVSAVGPLQPYMHRVADSSARIKDRVSGNTMGFAIGIAALFGGIALFSYYRSRQHTELGDSRELYGDLYGSKSEARQTSISTSPGSSMGEPSL